MQCARNALIETLIVAFYVLSQCDRDPDGDSGDGGGCDCQVLLKRLLTPRTLHALGIVSDLTTVNDGVIHFTASQNHTRLLRFAIAQPGQVPPELCSATSCSFVFNIQVHFLRSPTADSSPIVAVCDNSICNAVAILDVGNYPTVPCQFHTFTSGPIATNVISSADCGGETVEDTNFTNPRMVNLYFVLQARFGSFTIPAGNGFTAIGTFDRQLDLAGGANLEIYSSRAGEQYRLGHIIIEVFRV